MTIAFLSVIVKHERRVRLVFSKTLDSGAFASTSFYEILSSDDLGVDPGISAAIPITTDPKVVELALSDDLVIGGLYTITANAVPGADASVTPTPSQLSFRYGSVAVLRDVEPINLNREDLVYGVDLLWNGVDYQETASGDLDRIGGTANVTKALYRGLEAQGLTWDQNYGARLRDFVDSPSPSSGTMRGNVQTQVLSDPRVKTAKVAVTTDDSETFLVITPTLVTGATLEPVSQVVPSG